MSDIDTQHLRLLEAVLFAAAEPLDRETMAVRLPEGADIDGLLAALVETYRNRGVNLVRNGGRWAFRTAPDLAAQLRVFATQKRKLSRAAIETLAIIAYHQPVTRAEVEEIRGVGLSRGTLDILFEAGWIAPKGRRRTPGRPVTWGTTPAFLGDFGIDELGDLPGLDELKATGLLDKRPAIQLAGIDVGSGESEDPEDSEDNLDEDQPLSDSDDSGPAGSEEDTDDEPKAWRSGGGEAG
ncbi:MAG: SMC-Scp complex subunit ScpB [Alphaproteobacteria bacterium]